MQARALCPPCTRAGANLGGVGCLPPLLGGAAVIWGISMPEALLLCWNPLSASLCSGPPLFSYPVKVWSDFTIPGGL